MRLEMKYNMNDNKLLLYYCAHNKAAEITRFLTNSNNDISYIIWSFFLMAIMNESYDAVESLLKFHHELKSRDTLEDSTLKEYYHEITQILRKITEICSPSKPIWEIVDKYIPLTAEEWDYDADTETPSNQEHRPIYCINYIALKKIYEESLELIGEIDETQKLPYD